MVSRSERLVAGSEFANVLQEGQFVNSCTMISPSCYLNDYKLTYDGTVPYD